VGNVAFTAWQWCVIALVSVIATMVVSTYLKRSDPPDQKRKNDE
jgi:hypothetical protein